MLTQLVLDHNLLRHLPPVVLALPALAVLMASSNSITYLPDGLGQMQQLQALLMHSNQLMQVRLKAVHRSSMPWCVCLLPPLYGHLLVAQRACQFTCLVCLLQLPDSLLGIAILGLRHEV